MTNPPTNTVAPHSCMDICSRKRHTCSHSCPLPCHPGPCPPCQVALVVPCPSHNYPLTVKCHMSSSKQTSLTPVCGTDCSRELACGNMDHVCDSPCHYGPCKPCEVREVVRCYCGKHDKEVACGLGKDKELYSTRVVDGEEEHWKGRYNCGEACDQFFDCGVHPCKEVSPHCQAARPSIIYKRKLIIEMPPTLDSPTRMPLLALQDHPLPMRSHPFTRSSKLPPPKLYSPSTDLYPPMPERATMRP